MNIATALSQLVAIEANVFTNDATSIAHTATTALADAVFGETTQQRRGQTFTAPGSGSPKAERATVLLKKVGSPTDDVECRLYATSGGLPTGAALATATLDGSLLTTAYQTVTFNWPELPALTLSAVYALEFRRSGASNGSNYYALQVGTGPAYAAGSALHYPEPGGPWTVTTGFDATFAVFDVPTASVKRAYPYFPNKADAIEPHCFINSWEVAEYSSPSESQDARFVKYQVKPQLFVDDADPAKAAEIAANLHGNFLDTLDAAPGRTLSGAVLRHEIQRAALVNLEWAGKNYIGVDYQIELWLTGA